MENKKCLFCSEEIQFNAIKCKYCGEYQGEVTRKILQQSNVDHAVQKRKKNDMLLIILLFIIIISVFTFYLIYQSSLKSNYSAKNTGNQPTTITTPTITENTQLINCLKNADLQFKDKALRLCNAISSLAGQASSDKCKSIPNDTVNSLVNWVENVKTTVFAINSDASLILYQFANDSLDQRNQDINNCYIRFK